MYPEDLQLANLVIQHAEFRTRCKIATSDGAGQASQRLFGGAPLKLVLQRADVSWRPLLSPGLQRSQLVSAAAARCSGMRFM